MTAAHATALLARAQWQALKHRVRGSLRENRLLTLTITAFLTVYAAASYILVARGVDYLGRLPVLGPLLAERMIYLLFFFFFIMLVISNATITGMGLFRRREGEWQMALPIPARSLVVWKTLEGMLLASWGLLALSAPILAALGRMFEAGPGFYLANVPGLLCLVVIAANLSTWLLLAAVRWARRWWWWPAGALAAVAVIAAVMRMWAAPEAAMKPGDVQGNVNLVLRHTEVCLHELLPSSWLAESILATGRGIAERAWFFNLVLLSHAIMALLVTSWIAGRWFAPGWDRIMSAGGARRRKSEAALWFRRESGGGGFPAWLRWLDIDRASAALLAKDGRAFIREPVQWGQSALVFGLLFIYTSNLRRLGYDVSDRFWSVVLGHLNVLVNCLALSTLTTRFIFPQFSMEGQRLWFLGLSPLPVERVLSLKLRLGGCISAMLTSSLVWLSSLSIPLPGHRLLFFIAAMILMSFGLTALALSLGALCPNFRESNPAKIVSGFGGTLCLIASFLYILTAMAVMLLPAVAELKPALLGLESSPLLVAKMELLAISGVAAASLIFGAVPYLAAKNHTKKLDYLTKL